MRSQADRRLRPGAVEDALRRRQRARIMMMERPALFPGLFRWIGNSFDSAGIVIYQGRSADLLPAIVCRAAARKGAPHEVPPHHRSVPPVTFTGRKFLRHGAQ